jgi:hypothetical protein
MTTPQERTIENGNELYLRLPYNELHSEGVAPTEKPTVEWLKKTPQVARFRVHGTTASLMNGIRRCSISEVPTVAIEYCYVYENVSVLWDEFIVHRLGLVPLRLLDPTLRPPNIKPGDSAHEHTGGLPDTECLIQIDLDKKNDTRQVITVTSDDLVCEHGRVQVVHTGKRAIPIMKLGPGHKIKIKSYAVLGTCSDHGKFMPTCCSVFEPCVSCDMSAFPDDWIPKAWRKQGTKQGVIKHSKYAGLLQMVAYKVFPENPSTAMIESLKDAYVEGFDYDTCKSQASMADPPKLLPDVPDEALLGALRKSFRGSFDYETYRKCQIQDVVNSMNAQVVPGLYEMRIESVGSIDATDIVRQSVRIMMRKLGAFQHGVQLSQNPRMLPSVVAATPSQGGETSMMVQDSGLTPQDSGLTSQDSGLTSQDPHEYGGGSSVVNAAAQQELTADELWGSIL